MADSKLQQLTLRTGPTATDLVYLVIPGDADPDRRVTLATLAAALHAFLEVETAPEANDSPGTSGQWYYDAANNIKYECIATDTWIQILPTDTFDNS